MIYLNYNRDYPITFEALDAYNKSVKENVLDNLKQSEIIKKEIKNIANIFNVMDSEINFTTGVTEANNIALIGTAIANHKKGNHIIVSRLEDSSVYKICDYLTSIGFVIDYVNNDKDGLIDFDDLKRLVKEDTILVSIAAVNANMGIRQPLKMIRQIIKKENQNTLLHSDFSYAIGKVAIGFHDVDLASVSSSLIGGPKGIGLLYKSDIVKVSPLMYGKNISCFENDIPLIKSFSVALLNAVNDIEKKEHFISRLNEKIINGLRNIDVNINRTNYSIAHIINISLPNNNAGLIYNALKEKKIFVGYVDGLDTSVMAVYNDKKRASYTLVISLSYKTTTEEVSSFIGEFLLAYNKYRG